MSVSFGGNKRRPGASSSMVTDAIRAGSLNLALRNATNQSPTPLPQPTTNTTTAPTSTTTTTAPTPSPTYSAAPYIVSNSYILSIVNEPLIEVLTGNNAIYANNVWVATGTVTNNLSGGEPPYTNIWTSVNASDWVEHPGFLVAVDGKRQKGASASVWYNDGVWVAGGVDASGYNIATSTDASEWTRHFLVEGGDVGVSYVRNVNNLWVAFRPPKDTSDSTNVYTSTNASDWTAYTVSSEGNTPTFKDVAFFNGNYLLLGAFNPSELIYAGTSFESMNRVFSYETLSSTFLTLTSLSGQCIANPATGGAYVSGSPIYAITQDGINWNTAFPNTGVLPR